MKPLASQMHQNEKWEYMHHKVGYKDLDRAKMVKNSQFAQPLFEFSGACAGCGETPYIKTITQLFGDRMMVANATGCTSIYSGSAPSTPYCTNSKGHGPAWANSLFEDNAEFGLGMKVAVEKRRDMLASKMAEAIENCNECSAELKATMQEWIDGRHLSATSAEVAARLLPMAEACGCDTCKHIVENKDLLVKKSQWIIGGDGWGYDIGFGGVDHVLASGEDVNILIVDTEVYSNTGGQSSKATPTGAIAQFAAAGKDVKKKDLAAIAMSYGYVYVAQIAQGADYNQCVKAIAEAEAYPGPSLIIAYAPCINHGIKKGMAVAMTEEKLAVQSGYWNIFRFNPAAEKKFSLDCKPATVDYAEFLKGEVRYTSLQLKNPARAEKLWAKAAENAKEKYAHLEKLVDLYDGTK
jgi:pyruvate-ferredoxin/flavodoxin oxidoreductase